MSRDPWSARPDEPDLPQGAVESVAAQPYRDAMARLGGGVAVVTTRDVVGRDCGMTATAVSAVSLVPPLVLICVRREGFIHDALLVSDGWLINLLADDQVGLARYAARRHHPGDRDDFSAWPHRRGKVVDALALTGGVGIVECVPYEFFDAGDHTIAVGRVVAVADDTTGTSPLIYVDRGYHRLGEGT